MPREATKFGCTRKLAVAGGLVVILSFTLDGWSLVEQRMPAPHKAWLFWLGWAMAATRFAAGWRKSALQETRNTRRDEGKAAFCENTPGMR